jgi:hypothetical protein
MMMKSRRMSEAATRFEERRQREHDAQRLRARVPSLATLRLDVVEGHGAISASPKHARIIMVETGPALFELACADPSCRDGGYDLTLAVIRGLLEGKPHFEVDGRCCGNVGSVDCGRNVHVDVTATYNATAS